MPLTSGSTKVDETGLCRCLTQVDARLRQLALFNRHSSDSAIAAASTLDRRAETLR